MKRILIIIVFLSLYSCKNSDSVNEIKARHIINPLEFKIITNIDKYIDSMIVVNLEATKESCLTMPLKMLIDKNKNIIIHDGQKVIKFAKNGSFVSKIGSRGRSRSEYLTLRDVAINNNDQILLLDGLNKIIYYSNIDDSLIKVVEPQWPDKKISTDAILPANRGGYFLISSNPAALANFKDDFYCLQQFDANNKFVDECILREDYVMTMFLTTQSQGNKYLLRPMAGSNICYALDSNDTFVPMYAFDYNAESVPSRYIFDSNGKIDIKKYMFSDYYKLTSSIIETKNKLIFNAAGPNAITHNFIYSKDSSDGIHYYSNNIEDAILQFYTSDDEYFYALLNRLPSQDTQCPISRYILNNLDKSYNFKENPILLKFKFNIK